MKRNVDNYHNAIEGTVLGAGRKVFVKYLGREESVIKQLGIIQYLLTRGIHRNRNSLNPLPSKIISDPRILSLTPDDRDTTTIPITEETTGNQHDTISRNSPEVV